MYTVRSEGILSAPSLCSRIPIQLRTFLQLTDIRVFDVDPALLTRVTVGPLTVSRNRFVFNRLAVALQIVPPDHQRRKEIGD